MKTNNEKWLKEKVIVTLTRKEMFDLSNLIADGTRNESDFLKVRDRRIRKMFRDSINRRHKLWMKVMHTAERG